jgi:thioredoxin reductase (NADPH)
VPGAARLTGAGVYYGAAMTEALACRGEDVYLVGGANSAGQAAVFLSGVAKRVNMLVRGPGLSESMSRYLIQRIESTPNVTLRTRTQVDALEGDRGLERVRWKHVDSGERETHDIRRLPAAGREEVREDRRRPAARGPGGGALAAAAAALPDGDQHPRRLLRR